MPYFAQNGFRMHYEVHTGLVPMDTLFLHGNLASNHWWTPSLAEWRKLPYKQENTGALIFAEWRGCGKSSGPATEDELQLPLLAQDYIELLRYLEIKKANLIGHSTGGLIALYAAYHSPELFHRLVLLDSVSATGVQFSEPVLNAYAKLKESREFCAALMHNADFAHSTSPELLEQIIDDTFSVHPYIWDGVTRMLRNIDFRQEVQKIAQPTLVLHGEKDLILPLKGSQELASLLPNGHFQALQGQGHSCNMENPSHFVNISHKFLFN